MKPRFGRNRPPARIAHDPAMRDKGHRAALPFQLPQHPGGVAQRFRKQPPVFSRPFTRSRFAISEVSGTDEIAPELFAQLADQASDAVLIADIRRRGQPIVYANAAFEQLTGYRSHEAIGKNCRYLQGADRLQPEIDDIRQAIAARTSCAVRLRNYRKDGTLFWNHLRLVPLGPSKAPTHYAGFLHDITDLVEAEARIDTVINCDALTGCLNRDGLLAALGPLCAEHRILLIKIDIARFHDINSGYGYDLGDAVLRETVRRLATLDDGIVARIGNDQFAVVLPLPDDKQVAAILARVARALGSHYDLPGAVLTVRFATGYTIGGQGDAPLTLARQAGAALAQSKSRSWVNHEPLLARLNATLSIGYGSPPSCSRGSSQMNPLSLPTQDRSPDG